MWVLRPIAGPFVAVQQTAVHPNMRLVFDLRDCATWPDRFLLGG